MTIEQKRRELFEATVTPDCDLGGYVRCEENPPYEYLSKEDSIAWLAFNAALDAVVIELPEMSDYIDRHGQGENCDSYLIDLRDAIESTGLGLKVKL